MHLLHLSAKAHASSSTHGHATSPSSATSEPLPCSADATPPDAHQCLVPAAQATSIDVANATNGQPPSTAPALPASAASSLSPGTLASQSDQLGHTISTSSTPVMTNPAHVQPSSASPSVAAIHHSRSTPGAARLPTSDTVSGHSESLVSLFYLLTALHSSTSLVHSVILSLLCCLLLHTCCICVPPASYHNYLRYDTSLSYV